MTINEGTGTWETTTWPWPQVLFGNYYTLGLALVSTNVWLFDLYCDTSDIWQGTAKLSLGANATIDHVDFADFHSFYAISTFAEVANVITVDGVIRDLTGGGDDHTLLPTANIPKFGTCCNFNGQGIIGCIDHASDADFGDAGYNTVMWSAIKSFDFLPYDSTREKTLDQTAGWTHMDWGEYRTGIVYKVKKLGNVVVVYGNGGLCQLIPVEEPTVTFARGPVFGVGIGSANHIAGDDNRHLYLDHNNELWLVELKAGPQKLGYKDYMEDLTNANIRITYAPSRKRFFISDGVTGYGLTEHGLYSTNQLVCSVGDYRGKNLCGFYKDDEDYEWRIESGDVDFKQRGFKTLTNLEVGANYTKETEDIETSVKYRFSYKNSLSQTDWIIANPNGISTPMISGIDFRFLVRGADYRSAIMTLDYLIARAKFSDKRNVRGLRSSKGVSKG